MADSNAVPTNEVPSQDDVAESPTEHQNQNASEIPPIQQKHNNNLPMWGNKDTMNLNHLVLENILQSPYYRNKLSTLKTFHEVVDEIYYNVGHLEPWEKGTRKTTGQTGMCGGVRGVGAGGVVSTPFCLLFKLFMMKLTRKQLCTLLNHADSPFIRGLGFMYVRFCQQPASFWEWYEPYLEDEEAIDPKAGGGDPITIGQMCKMFLTKLEWYSTLFPRIPVPVQKDIDSRMREHNKKTYEQMKPNVNAGDAEEANGQQQQRRKSRSREASRSRDHHSRATVDVRRDDHRSKGKEQRVERSTGRQRSKSPSASRHRRSRSLSTRKRVRSRSRSKDRTKTDRRSKSKERTKVDRRSKSKERTKVDRRSKSKERSKTDSNSKERIKTDSKSKERRHHSRSKHRLHSRHRQGKDGDAKGDENARRHAGKGEKRRRHHHHRRRTVAETASEKQPDVAATADDEKESGSRSVASREKSVEVEAPAAKKLRSSDEEVVNADNENPSPANVESREEGELMDDGKN